MFCRRFRAPILLCVFSITLVSTDSYGCNDALMGEAERRGLLRLPELAQSKLRELGLEAENSAEKASVYFHQEALLEAFPMAYLEKLGVNYRAAKNFRDGIVKSDYGKLATYKKWLTESSEDTTALLSALQLKGKSPLTEILFELNEGKPFINPDLPLETVRQIFASNPALVGYFHEFPGMRAAEKQLQNGELSYRDFREVILSIYGHNGPGDPGYTYRGAQTFWAGVPNFIKGGLAKSIEGKTLPAEAGDFFKGTSFLQPDGSIRYHEPKTALAFEHMLFDRFDGFRDSRKIREEIAFMKPLSAEVNMLLGSRNGNLAALNYNKDVLLPKMVRDGRISNGDYLRLTKATEGLITRLEVIGEKFQAQIENAAELERKFAAQEPIESITFRIANTDGTVTRRTFTCAEVGEWGSQSAQSFRDFVDQNIRRPAMIADVNSVGSLYGTAQLAE